MLDYQTTIRAAMIAASEKEATRRNRSRFSHQFFESVNNAARRNAGQFRVGDSLNAGAKRPA